VTAAGLASPVEAAAAVSWCYELVAERGLLRAGGEAPLHASPPRAHRVPRLRPAASALMSACPVPQAAPAVGRQRIQHRSNAGPVTTRWPEPPWWHRSGAQAVPPRRLQLAMPSHLAATQLRIGRLAPCPVALECMSPRRASRESPQPNSSESLPARIWIAAVVGDEEELLGVSWRALAREGVSWRALAREYWPPRSQIALPGSRSCVAQAPLANCAHKVFNLCHQSIPHSVQDWSHRQLEKSASSQLCGPNDCPARSLVRSSFPLRLNSLRSSRSTVCKHGLTRTAGARRLISLSVNSRRIGRGYSCSGLACTRFWHTQRMIPPLFAFAVVRCVRHV